MIKIKISENLERHEPILVPLNTTIRAALESSEVNYTNTTVELNHHPIAREDLDCTFAELGIEEEAVAFITCITKLNNAARMVKFNNTYVIQVDFGREDIAVLEEQFPDALTLMNDNFDLDFRVTYGDYPEVSKYGVCFATENTEHQCSIAVVCESDEEFVSKYGRIIQRLEKVEEAATEKLLEIETPDIIGRIETM